MRFPNFLHHTATKGLLSILLLLLLLPSAVMASPMEASRIAAAVDQRIITESDLDFWILEARLSDPLLWELPEEDLRQDYISPAIDEIMLADWAETILEELPADLLRQRTRDLHRRLRDQAGGETRLIGFLEDSSLEPEDLLDWLERRARHRLLIEQAIASRLPMGMEDAMEGGARDAVALRVSVLIVRIGSDREAAWERALTIRREIAGGLSFSNAVRLFSEDPHARQTGGDLGWLTHDELAKPLWDEAIKLRRGDVTLPIMWNNRYYMIQLMDFETERQRAFIKALRREELTRIHEQREIRRIRLAEGYTLDPLPEIPE
ncbi:MAG: peptidylprolyl isomerase [Candidatus Sumerlaeia bacterium]|nr:peptidylprolyl isomerase [Candidatus Sumerlaeia bacterium]